MVLEGKQNLEIVWVPEQLGNHPRRFRFLAYVIFVQILLKPNRRHLINCKVPHCITYRSRFRFVVIAYSFKY